MPPHREPWDTWLASQRQTSSTALQCPALPSAGPASVPADFEAELGKYTREGLRVLGLAARELTGATESDVLVRGTRRGGDGQQRACPAVHSIGAGCLP